MITACHAYIIYTMNGGTGSIPGEDLDLGGGGLFTFINKHALKLGDAEDVALYVNYEWEDQCNLEVSNTILKRLGDLKWTLCISTYEKEDT